MPTVLFGSISTVADTSELQREAFNKAFAEHGLDWSWERDDYVAMLTGSGGRSRIAEYAASRGESVDATAVHDTKSTIFQEDLASAGLPPRPGVADVVRAARADGTTLALVTTTARENLVALLESLAPDVTADDFALVTDVTTVERPKPDPAVYAYALRQLGVAAADAVAIEDNVGGVQAAVGAGLRCVAFPNHNTADHDFGAATVRVDRLDPAALRTVA